MNTDDYEFFLSKKLLPKGFNYPSEYVEFTSGEMPDLEPWHFFYSRLEYRYKGMKGRYPDQSLVPFARRQDNDDVACFDASMSTESPKVKIIHDFASPGWEDRVTLDDFTAWLILAETEAKEWED